ncbi:MAG: HAMP domain-containing sensor histidine kinase [Spirochaetaceae bacterium]|nr:HAMP domain-containing sensor histidine kinase [Spirochaetaceae bacterium]
MKQSINLQKRLILFAVITLLVPVGAIIFTAISFINSSGRQAREDQLTSIMNSITTGIGSYQDKIYDAANFMADLEILQIKLQVYKKYWDSISVETRITDVSLLKDELVKYAVTGDFDNLSIYRRTNDRYVSIFTLGNSINLPGIVTDESIAIHKGKPFYSRNSEGLYLSEGLYVSIYKEIILNGEKEGLLVVEKNFDYNYFTTQSIRFNTDIAVFVNGRQLYSSLPFEINDNLIPGSYPSDNLFTEIKNESGNFYLNSQNFMLQDKIRGSLIIANLNNGITRDNSSLIIPLLMIGFAGLLIPLISFLLWNNSLINSILRLVKATDEVSKGNYSHHIKRKRNDEMGALTNAFNNMTSSLKETNDSLIRSGKLAAVGQFSAGIAHEIGNPMSVILNHVQLMQSGYLTDKERTEYLDRIEDEVRRVNTMILKLLNFSKDENRKMLSLDVKLLIEDVIALFMPKFKRKNVLALFSNKTQSAIISGNRDSLKQVLYNLLNNAVEAIKKGNGHIDIVLFKQSHHVCIEISDDGIGMDNQMIEKIFDPFFSNKGGNNTGLGLGLSEKIIKQHNGTIEIKSEPGKGSRFTLCFPIKEDRES